MRVAVDTFDGFNGIETLSQVLAQGEENEDIIARNVCRAN